MLRADSDTVFPLLAAMGIEMTQTLFLGENTLLVEGPSDMIYLDVLSDAAEAAGRTGLDPAWVKTPIGGAGKLSTFATLLGANQLNVAVLVDSSTKDAQAVQHLRENGQLANNGLVEIREFTTNGDADIEDLLDRDFYLTLVNKAYAKDLQQPITAADLNRHDPRIVRQVEAYFRQHNITNGRFSHYKPAAVLLREQAILLPQITAAVLERAEQLFISSTDSPAPDTSTANRHRTPAPSCDPGARPGRDTAARRDRGQTRPDAAQPLATSAPASNACLQRH